MNSDVTHRDLLICQLVCEREWLSDDQLESVVRRWHQQPAGALFDAVRTAANLTQEQLQQLRGQIDSQIAETCIDPETTRLQALPAGVRQALAGIESEEAGAMTTDRRFETLPSDGGGSSISAPSAVHFPEDNRFEIIELHAQGGLGVVYVARDGQIDRSVAIKQIKPRWADSENSRVRFLQEARITGRLEHPGIVPIYAIGSDSTGRPFYAMRFIRGDSLLQVLERFHAKDRLGQRRAEDRLSQLRKLIQRFIDVCNTIEYAHSKGVLHRDIKPANIILGRFGETLVVDWGLAKVVGSEDDVSQTTRITWTEGDSHGSTPTMVGAAIGTPAYMSPEQAAGRVDELGPTSDVYSLGATLYQLITSALPHGEEKDVGVLLQKLSVDGPTPPRKIAPWIPRPLEAICLKALSLHPKDRYRSPRSMAEDLQRWLSDEPVSAYDESRSERAWRWVRNHRTLVASLTVAQVLLTVTAVIGFLGWNHIQQQQRTQAAERQRRVEQRRVELASSISGGQRSAETEIREGRFADALTYIDLALEDCTADESFSPMESQLREMRLEIEKLAAYRMLGERAEELAFFQQDAEATAALFQALETIGAFDHGDWWDRLPSELLTAEQLDVLRWDVYRKLILLAASYAKETYRGLLHQSGARAASEVLAVNPLVQRFRPAVSTGWHASAARMRLGQGMPQRAGELADPQNAADAYMMAAIWVVASQNSALRTMMAAGEVDLLDAAREELSLVESLAPDDYWSHFLRGFVELQAAGKPTETPPDASHPLYVAARRAFGHCIAIDPDYWLAYAERSGACRQEIESRRAANMNEVPTGWESTSLLQSMMMQDVLRARELAPSRSEVRWYVAFALQTAGQIDAAVAEALEAIDLGARFDVETRRRMVDPELQRALPEVVQVATRLLAEDSDNASYLLLRASANLRLGEVDQAAEDIENVLSKPAPPPRAWTVRGWINLAQDEPDRAASDFERTLNAMPHHVASLIGLAHAHEAAGDYDAAIASFDLVLPHAATEFQRASAHLGRCRCLVRLNRFDEASDAIEAARTARPSCEVSTVAAVARKVGETEFADRVEALTAPQSVADHFRRKPANFATLPLLNAGFESADLRHWTGDQLVGLRWANIGDCQSIGRVSTDQSHSGERSLHIAHQSRAAPGCYGVTSQTIPAVPNSRYKLTLWVRAKELSENAIGASVADEPSQPLILLPGGTYDWREMSSEFTTDAADPSNVDDLVAVRISLFSAAPGDAWVDDVRIERVETPETTD